MHTLENHSRQNFFTYWVKHTICLFLLVGVGTGIIFTQAFGQLGELPIPIIQNVNVQAEVIFDPVTQRYTYTYTVSSPGVNTGEIWHLGLDMTTNIRPTSGIPAFDPTGLTIPVGASGLKPFDQVLADRQPMLLTVGTSVIPFGQRVPAGWTGGLRRDGFGSFYSDARIYRITPGSSLGGFELISGGLPSIRKMEVEPFWIFVSEGDATPEDEQAAIEIEKSIIFHTKTIGPTAPPFDLRDLLEKIFGYIDESVALGWLIDPSLTDTLRAELNTARSYIEVNDPSSAKSALQRFMTALDSSSSAQRTAEAYSLLFYNAQYLKNKLPDTYIPPPPPVLELKPEKATLPIGTIHTLTATLTQDSNPLQDYPVNVKVISGPNLGLMLNSKLTDINGQAVFSYTSTKVGIDKLVAQVEMIIMQSPKPWGVLVAMNNGDTGSIPVMGNDYNTYLLIAQESEPMAESLPAEVTWTGGPDLLIKFFIPPLIKSEGGKPIFITEITGNEGNTDAGPSITRYFLSEDENIDPNQDRAIGERAVPSLPSGEESDGGTNEFILPNDIPAGTYYLGACADANQSVVELDEQNNCEINKLAIVVPMELSPNQPPDCTQATPSINSLWPPNHKLVNISINGVTDADGDPITITITHITQDEPVNRLGDGDSAPDGFGVGTSEAQIRAERSGTGNGRVYTISFTADDGKGGDCTNTVQVGVPHDQGKGQIPIDDGQNYDSTSP